MVEVKPINISLNQQSPSLSVRTAISPTLTEEFIIHPSVYSEIEKLGHAKSDVLLSESESSLSVDYGVSFPNVSVSILCKKANGAMKTSSVEFISQSPTPSPMNSNYRRTLQRKISMRSTKDQLVEKDVLMPVQHNVFLWNLPDVEEVPSHDGETV
ncbi:hypothetical protein TNCV_3118671 [Trichonephila clavipes]|uniref:Uncharacterized protein n=1 Tax=Trichonephila clavipes TaxID=2585209 RepID=A0A8X7BHM7_TRICX|nr:hypothetical protein TNCV_3118671 [Trichonephila clavipes]